MTTSVGVLACACRHAPSGDADAARQSLVLDGKAAYVEAAFPEADPFTAEATLSTWVNFDELPSRAGRIFSIVGKSGFARDLDLQAEPDDHFHFYVGIGAPNVAISTRKIEAGRWYRVDATYRAGTWVKVYVNGVLDGSKSIGERRQPNPGALAIGFNLVFPNRWFHGRIDEVALWNRALSDAEIAAQSDLITGHESGLVAAYHFEGDARDAVGAHDGLLRFGATIAPPGAPLE